MAIDTSCIIGSCAKSATHFSSYSASWKIEIGSIFDLFNIYLFNIYYLSVQVNIFWNVYPSHLNRVR